MSPTSVYDHHVDTILDALGSDGKFIVLQSLTAIIGFFPAGFHLLSHVFIGFPVPHRCAQPENDSTIPSHFLDHSYANISYDRCEILMASNFTVLNKTGCSFGMKYFLPVDRSFVSDFDLVCNSDRLARLSHTIFVAGQGVGAFVFTFISDRLGRKPVIVGSNIGLLVAGIILAFAPNYTVFAVFKFSIGVFQQGPVTGACTYLLEIFVTKDRRKISIIAGYCVPLVYLTLDLLAYLLMDYSWRTLQLVISLSSLLAFFQWWYLEESLRWLVANGKSRSVTRYIKRAAECNGKDFLTIKESLHMRTNEMAKDDLGNGNRMKDSEVILIENTKKLTLLDIIRDWNLILTTAVMWFVWIIAALGYFVIYLTSTSLSGNPYLNFFLISIMELPASTFFYFSFNRIGRRRSLIICYFLLGVGLITSSVILTLKKNNVTKSLSLASFCISMIGASGAFGGIFFYTPEMYPTNFRNQALGMCSLVARIGGMIAPFITLIGEQNTYWNPGVAIGCLTLLAAALLLIPPETNKKELPQTLDELQHWFKKSKTSNINPGDQNEEPKEEETFI